MAPGQLFSLLSLWMVSLFYKSDNLCLYFILYLHVCIRFHNDSEYRSNTDPDPQHWLSGKYNSTIYLSSSWTLSGQLLYNLSYKESSQCEEEKTYQTLRSKTFFLVEKVLIFFVWKTYFNFFLSLTFSMSLIQCMAVSLMSTPYVCCLVPRSRLIRLEVCLWSSPSLNKIYIIKIIMQKEPL